ncbi:MAG: PQQ-binding-like beta-propeller repeat protein [Limisphaerales bacterium]
MPRQSLNITGKARRSAAAALVVGSVLCANAADWTQYLGPTRNGVSTETGVAKFPSSGPRKLWQHPTPGGFSSFAIGNGIAVTMTLREIGGAEQEICLALDTKTGKELWGQAFGVANFLEHGGGGANSGKGENKGGDGPRSTPAITKGHVFATSANLVIACFDAKTGKQIWKHDLVKEFAGQNIHWNNAASPVIDNGLVFMAGGGEGQSLLAFEQGTGRVAWKVGHETITHSTPTVATIAGTRQVIFFLKSGLVSVDAKTGKILWKQPFHFNVSTAMSPLVVGDIVYCSAGYQVGSAAYRISKSGDKFTSTELWKQPASVINNHWSTPTVRDGFLYGLFGFKEFGTCPLKCVELSTGNVKWSQEGFGPGGTILAGDTLIVLGDAGQVSLVRADPQAYHELAKFEAVTGKCWNAPALSDGRLYVRSTKEAACFDLSGK